MKQQDYHCSISAALSTDEALEQISDVSAWWAKHVEGSTRLLHDVFTVRFGTTHVTFEISELIPGKKVVWSVTDCWLPFQEDKTEWTGTSVVWVVEPVAEGTRIEMTHVGLTPEVECFQNCQRGWNKHILESLTKLIDAGVGMPS